MRKAIAAVALLLALGGSASTPLFAANLIPIEGKDQHDEELVPGPYADRPLLLLWGDRKGSEPMLAWTRALADSAAAPLPVARLDVAHVRGAPFFVKGRIRKRFRRDWESTVLMDWKGRFAEAYDCAEDSCTVLLFDAEGRLARRWTVGPPEEATLKEIRRSAATVAAP